jgi:tetratricopeptide (TPR) repeat protein
VGVAPPRGPQSPPSRAPFSGWPVSDDRDNVIHISFGRDGARRVDPAETKPSKSKRKPPRGRDHAEDPLADLYSMSEVSRVFGLKESRLRYWDRSGFIQPTGKQGRRRYYTFQDLISLRVAKGLLDQGVPIREVRKSVEALRKRLPRVVRPLSELRVVADGQSIVVKGEDGSFEPKTGQLVLDFEVSALRDDVVRALRRRDARGSERQAAYELYLEGCRFDEDEATLARAEECYRRALALDPALSNALTNLGNLRFRGGHEAEAERFYLQALEIDPAQPEALYNLGFLCFERAETTDAAGYFRRALVADPGFADAHFNLAMACEELGRVEEAQEHWRVYLELDPEGSWAEIARRHLRER